MIVINIIIYLLLPFWLTPQLRIHIITEKATINMTARMPQRVGHTAHYLTWNNIWSKFQMREQQVVTKFWWKYSLFLFRVYVPPLTTVGPSNCGFPSCERKGRNIFSK